MALKKASEKLLAQIVAGVVTRVNQAEGIPLLQNDPPLITINVNDLVDNKALITAVTDAGKAMVNGATTTTTATDEVHQQFEIMSGVTLPPRKHAGRASGSSPYPFNKLEVGQTFFVPKSAKTPNPVKTLASTVSAQNLKYAVKTGETKEIERTKRGPKNKAILDASGAKVKETVTVPVMKHTRRFTMRSVTTGQVLDSWTAPSDGVLIAREA